MWWWTLTGSLAALVAGSLLLLAPLLSPRVNLLGFMAIALVVVAVFGVVTAIRGLRTERRGRAGRRQR
jgi:membrane protein implicated in regulation of membrane protease activity